MLEQEKSEPVDSRYREAQIGYAAPIYRVHEHPLDPRIDYLQRAVENVLAQLEEIQHLLGKNEKEPSPPNLEPTRSLEMWTNSTGPNSPTINYWCTADGALLMLDESMVVRNPAAVATAPAADSTIDTTTAGERLATSRARFRAAGDAGIKALQRLAQSWDLDPTIIDTCQFHW